MSFIGTKPYEIVKTFQTLRYAINERALFIKKSTVYATNIGERLNENDGYGRPFTSDEEFRMMEKDVPYFHAYEFYIYFLQRIFFLYDSCYLPEDRETYGIYGYYAFLQAHNIVPPINAPPFYVPCEEVVNSLVFLLNKKFVYPDLFFHADFDLESSHGVFFEIYNCDLIKEDTLSLEVDLFHRDKFVATISGIRFRWNGTCYVSTNFVSLCKSNSRVVALCSDRNYRSYLTSVGPPRPYLTAKNFKTPPYTYFDPE